MGGNLGLHCFTASARIWRSLASPPLPPFFFHPTTRHRQIDLAGNKLTGGIPDSIGNLTALSVLNLGSNALAGDIPAILGNGPLHEIILSDNNLTGSLPEVGQFQPLTTFEVANNLLEGSIPGSFGHLPLLATLNIQGNSISGPRGAWRLFRGVGVCGRGGVGLLSLLLLWTLEVL